MHPIQRGVQPGCCFTGQRPNLSPLPLQPYLKPQLRVRRQRRPHHLILFGRGDATQPWLSASSLSALEVPQKIPVFEDNTGKTWVAYAAATAAAQRQSITDARGIDQTIKAIDATVSGFADAVAEERTIRPQGGGTPRRR